MRSEYSSRKSTDRTCAFRADSNACTSAARPCRMYSIFLGYSWKPHSRIGSESALSRTALLASNLALNLEVLGRSLAAIGNFFVFHRLSFVKRGKASFLDRRNMNENVFAAT